MVVDGPQVEQVLLGDDGAVHGAAPGTLFIDMSTIAPADARRIGAALAERGLAFVDAPVTGSSPKARGRHADDHGRRQRGRRRARQAAASRRWAR